jgi:cytochrome c-type biogenesis protein CcmH/NrfG
MSKRELSPEARLAFDRAFELRESGQTLQAIAAFEKALAVHPEFGKGWLVLGGLHYERNEYIQAVEHFERAVRLLPRSEDCSLALFHALLNAGQAERAVEEARRYLLEIAAGAKADPTTLTMYRDFDADGIALAHAWTKSRN